MTPWSSRPKGPCSGQLGFRLRPFERFPTWHVVAAAIGTLTCLVLAGSTSGAASPNVTNLPSDDHGASNPPPRPLNSRDGLPPPPSARGLHIAWSCGVDKALGLLALLLVTADRSSTDRDAHLVACLWRRA